MQSLIGVLFALTSAFIWGTTTIIARVFLNNRGGLTLNILRLLISGPFYLVILLFAGFPTLTLSLTIVFILSSLAGFVIGDYFFFSAMKIMGVSRSVLLATMYPLWVIVLGFFLLGRTITPYILSGAAFIILAVAIVVFKKEEIQLNFVGVIFVVIAQFLWALAVISIDWLLEDIPVLQVTGMRIIFGATISLFLLPIGIEEIKNLKIKEWVFAALIAILGTVVAQYTFTMAIDLAGSSIAAPVAETNPLIATILAKLLLQERVTPKLFLAVLLTVVGVALLMM